MASNSSTPLPYPLTVVREGYEFTTAGGEKYLLYFSDASGYFEDVAADGFAAHALMLGLKRHAAGKLPAHDPRIAATLLDYARQAFDDPRRVVTYVCDTADARQQQRSRLFNLLFRKHNDGQFVKVEIAASGSLYASLIYRHDNPFAAQVLEQVPLLQQKISPYLP